MPDLAAFQRELLAVLAGPPAPGEPAGLAVHRNTALAGSVAALAATYPVARRVMGAEAFDAAATGFARLHPPASPVLAVYGCGFPDHLARTGWRTALPFLPDVARIDGWRAEAHVAADALPFAPTGRENWAALRLELHPATRFALLAPAAVRAWSRHSDTALPPGHGLAGVLVTRPFDAVMVRGINAAEAAMLAAVTAGARIAEAAEATLSAHPRTRLAPLFAGLISAGAFAAPEGDRP